ncbi:MAG: hypothetical protein ACTSU0_04040, partial [Alphaproteobacteria bacterium]
MTERAENLLTYGTSEDVPRATKVALGSIEASIDDGALRDLSWGNTPVVRGISCPIRDESWRTCAHQDVNDTYSSNAERARFERQFTVMDGDLAGRIIFEIEAGGRVEASLKLS